MAIIPDHLNPTIMDFLKAKSEDFSWDLGRQLTLAEHTWQVLEKLANQYQLRPHLAQQIGDERLWHRMYWGCFLHDFGKAALGFQHRLAKIASDHHDRWKAERHRHEVLSLAFVDWVFPKHHPDRIPVICIIASHHKDIKDDDLNNKYRTDIFYQYGSGIRSDLQHEAIEFVISQIDDEVRHALWRWLTEYSQAWQAHLGFPQQHDVQFTADAAADGQSIAEALNEVNHYFRHKSKVRTPQDHFFQDLLLRGLILTSDHAASAGTKAFPPLRFNQQVAWKPLAGYHARSHQQQAQSMPRGSCLMIAPTGSGKTEAAFLWLVRQSELQSASRLFYVLPYQASMNAMFRRIGKKYFDWEETQLFDVDQNDQVTIQHSRALLAFYQGMMDAEHARDKAKWLKNLGRLNYFPIQIFSPYQMLKAVYSLKGYEALLVDYAQALFVFDEIHAYEAKRLALIITTMGWLADHFGARFLVMTATLPPTVRKMLMEALHLDESDVIVADAKDFAQAQRHIVHVHSGSIMDDDNRERIIAHVREQQNAILICCNRVATAQAVYDDLVQQKVINPNNVMLLHSRFNGRDRNEREHQLAQYVGVGQSRRIRPFVLVSTQVVEVSLDVDFDTIFTEPAPLEALLQRFGRVNRGRKEKQLLPVHVFEIPFASGSTSKPYLPYGQLLVEASIRVLRQECDGLPIDESRVSELLELIYRDEILENWQAEYIQQKDLFEESILGAMKAFQSASSEMAKRFYEMFDSVEVLPSDLANAYYDAIEEGGYLAASQYLVSVSHQQYAEFSGYGRIRPAKDLEDEFVDHIDVPYDENYGLLLDQTRDEEKAKKRRGEN